MFTPSLRSFVARAVVGGVLLLLLLLVYDLRSPQSARSKFAELLWDGMSCLD